MASGSIDPSYFAPCGMNCMVCYKHLGKRACPGCLSGGENKPEHCRVCMIKSCTEAKGVRYCFQCGEFPCKQLKALDKSYRVRYGTSLVELGLSARAEGIEECLRDLLLRYTCPGCGGIISLHDGDCSECGKAYPMGRRSGEK